MNAEAKITGVTPAGLVLIGIYVCFSSIKLSPEPVCWIGIFLYEVSKNAIRRITPSDSVRNRMNVPIPAANVAPSEPVIRKFQVPDICEGIDVTIPVKIIIEVPCPIPFIVILSAIQVVIIVPAVRIVDTRMIFAQ